MMFDRFKLSPRAPILIALASLAGFWVLFFWSILVRRSHFIPFDLLDQHYMFQAFISRSLHDSDSLWWSPNITGGYPTIADPLAALFYPPNFLMHLLIPRELLPYLAVELQATLHFLLTAIGMFFLARLLTGSTAGGMVAGLAWAYGSYFVWHLPHLSPVSTLSWLPWILFAYAMALRSNSLIWTALAAAAAGMMMLAGHAMTILQITYLLIGLSILLALLRWHRTWTERLMPIASAGALLVLGAGIAAVQLLPAWQLSGISERGDFGFAAAADSSFAPYWSITALIPNFFSVFDPGEYWAAGDPAETNLYMGLIPLVLAAIAIVGARLSDRKTALLLLGGVIGAMLLAFGIFAWPFQLTYDLLPGFDRVRRPVTFIAFAQFGIALLAAFGIKVLTSHPSLESAWPRLGRWLGIGAIVAFALVGLTSILMVTNIGEPAQQQFIGIISGTVLAGVLLVAAFAIARARQQLLLSAGTAAVLLVVLVAVDLGSAHKAATYRTEDTGPTHYVGLDWVYNRDNDLVKMLREVTDPGGSNPSRILPDATASVWANGPFVWDLHSASGYIVLCPVAYCDLLEHARANPSSPMLDMMNVRYLVTDHEIAEHYGEAAAEKFELAHFDGLTNIYENPDVMPRAWITHQSTHQSEDQVLPYLLENPDQIGSEVVLSDDAAPVLESSGESSGQAEITEYENTAVSLDVSMPEEGYLVLSDTYYPGWSATANGDEIEIFRANHAFRAVHLPEGEHRVEFTYQQPRLVTGAIISGLSLLLTLGTGAAGIVIRRRADTAASHDPLG